jgi:hypothetical protein
MKESHWPAALHAALRFVITSDIVAEHKATLIEVLLQALRNDEAAAEKRREEVAHEDRAWQEDELVQLKSLLQDHVARSWQDADQSMMHAAAQLHRDPRSVRDKATELGLGAAVDYRRATALKLAREE